MAINQMGISSKSSVSTRIMKNLFITSFLNTGIVLLLTCNLKTGINLYFFYFTALNRNFYELIGKVIVNTMAINSISIWGEQGIFFSLKKIK